MPCPSCAQEIPRNVAFCPACGHWVAPVHVPEREEAPRRPAAPDPPGPAPSPAATAGGAAAPSPRESVCERNTALILALLPAVLGGLGCGMHRFYTGRVGTGILQFFTVGGLLIWQIVDVVRLVQGTFTDARGLPLRRV